jgi:predicted alpha-1,6-mannanase (GH76 family)
MKPKKPSSVVLKSKLLRRMPPSAGSLAIAAFLLAGSHSARAFTSTDANTAINAFNTAYYVGNGGNGYFKNDQTSGVSYFWTQAELIEGVEDANDRTGGTYNSMITSLLNGFSSNNGTSWSGNIYNDDICWACIAYLRGYQATGNVTFRNIAKANFDMMYARAWSSDFGGGLWWTTAKGGKNACVNGPAAITSYLLYQTLSDASYLTKSQNIFNWEKATLFNAGTGAVYDYISTGGVGTWSSTYNQGTFIGAANYLGDVATATTAMNFTKNSMSGANGSGGLIMPQYGAGGNNSGFNSIGIRWMAKFMKDRSLQSTYLGWLQSNANAAWAQRRADNLGWCQWLEKTPNSNNFYSWDTISTAVALQVVPADGVETMLYSGGTYGLMARHSGKYLDAYGALTANGTQLAQSTWNGGNNQKWEAQNLGGNQFAFKGVQSGRAVDVPGWATADIQLALWDYNGSAAQSWTVTATDSGYFKLANVNSGKVMDVYMQSTADGVGVYQSTWWAGGNQQWAFKGQGPTSGRTYRLIPRHASDKALDTQSGGTANGTKLVQNTYTGASSQKWLATNVGGNNYTFRGQASNRSIDVDAFSTADIQLQLWDYFGNAAQTFVVTPTDSSFYKVLNLNSGKAMEVYGISTADGAAVYQHTWNGGHNQQWLFQAQ